MSLRTLAVSAAALAAIPLAPTAAAWGAEARVGYVVAYAGIPIAKANVAVKTEAGLYTVRLGYRTTGVVKVVSSAKGEAEANGAVADGRLVSASYRLKSEEGKDSKDVAVVSEGGAVKSATAVPPLKSLESRVPILPAHLKATIDPLSGLLFPAPAGDPLAPAACDRTVPVYDGWTRYDIVFSYKGTTSLKVKGYKGPGVVCAARWVPVAGHRPTAASTKFLAENKDLDVTLVPSGTGLLLPVAATIVTMSGMITIGAERVQVDGD
jgi:hypothetical protein